MHTPMKPKMDISALLSILMACEKAGTASFLGYPVTLLLLHDPSFVTKVLTASFVKTVIGFPAINTKIACIYMASRSACCRVNNKPLALMSHMNNVENRQRIIRLCTNYCYCIISVVISVLLLFCTDTDIGKNCHIGGRYCSRSDYRYTSS